jgi:hypothetical protein
VTLSHFRSREGLKRLFAHLEPLRDVEIPPVTIESI